MKSSLLIAAALSSIYFYAGLPSTVHAENVKSNNMILINRREKTLVVKSSEGVILLNAAVGLGRGGLKQKKEMSDLVTPTGDFTVDIILDSASSYDRIDSKLRERYLSEARFAAFVENSAGLDRLFKDMLALDFNQDGAPDRAYGSAYIGLTSGNAVTGPKMHLHNGTPYWYSIAIHGIPDEHQDVSKTQSGGCVHLDAASLKTLIEKHLVDIGTEVRITD